MTQHSLCDVWVFEVQLTQVFFQEKESVKFRSSMSNDHWGTDFLCLLVYRFEFFSFCFFYNFVNTFIT